MGDVYRVPVHQVENQGGMLNNSLFFLSTRKCFHELISAALKSRTFVHIALTTNAANKRGFIVWTRALEACVTARLTLVDVHHTQSVRR